MFLPRRPLYERIPLEGPASFVVRDYTARAFDYPWHQHPEIELTWILKGNGLRYVGDSVESFREGDFCLLGAHLPHAWLSPESERRSRVRSLVVQFDPGRWGREFLQLPESARIADLFVRATRGLCFGAEAADRMREKILGANTPLLQLTALLEILDELAADTKGRALALAPWSHNKRMESDPRLKTVLAFLAERSGGPVQQAEVARLVRLSPAAFSRFFRRAVGKTFGAYLTDLRLSESCRQLLESDRTISEIAFDAGFGNLSNFNRSFRIARGMAPGEFRRRSRGGPSAAK